MNPDVTLEEIREAAQAVREAEGLGDTPDGDVVTLLDALSALDVWLSGGGFLPIDWAD